MRFFPIPVKKEDQKQLMFHGTRTVCVHGSASEQTSALLDVWTPLGSPGSHDLSDITIRADEHEGPESSEAVEKHMLRPPRPGGV